jgi:hypothetical protein
MIINLLATCPPHVNGEPPIAEQTDPWEKPQNRKSKK